VGKRTVTQDSHLVGKGQVAELGLSKRPVAHGTNAQRLDIDVLQALVDEGLFIDTGHAASGVKVDSAQ
jgi:hypothetical protein